MMEQNCTTAAIIHGLSHGKMMEMSSKERRGKYLPRAVIEALHLGYAHVAGPRGSRRRVTRAAKDARADGKDVVVRYVRYVRHVLHALDDVIHVARWISHDERPTVGSAACVTFRAGDSRVGDGIGDHEDCHGHALARRNDSVAGNVADVA